MDNFKLRSLIITTYGNRFELGNSLLPHQRFITQGTLVNKQKENFEIGRDLNLEIGPEDH